MDEDFRKNTSKFFKGLKDIGNWNRIRLESYRPKGTTYCCEANLIKGC